MCESQLERNTIEQAIGHLETAVTILKHLTNEPRCRLCGVTATHARVAGHFWHQDKVCSACQPTGPQPISFTPDVM